MRDVTKLVTEIWLIVYKAVNKFTYHNPFFYNMSHIVRLISYKAISKVLCSVPDFNVIEWKISKSFAEQSHNRFNSASKYDNW